MNQWANFFICIAAAAATLTGLIFVGVSISLNRILSIPKLPSRALSALVLLINIVIVSALCLVPQDFLWAGIEIMISAAATWAVTLWLDVDVLKGTGAAYKFHALRNIFFTQLSVLPYIVAAIFIMQGSFWGYYWIVPAVMFSIIKAVLDAWVLLIEIHR